MNLRNRELAQSISPMTTTGRLDVVARGGCGADRIIDLQRAPAWLAHQTPAPASAEMSSRYASATEPSGSVTASGTQRSAARTTAADRDLTLATGARFASINAASILRLLTRYGAHRVSTATNTGAVTPRRAASLTIVWRSSRIP